MAVSPSSAATSAGLAPSISVCHSTVCQLSGSEAQIRMTRLPGLLPEALRLVDELAP